MPTPIALDTETFYRLGKAATPSIKSQGTYGYTHDPEFEVLMISVSDGNSWWCGPPEDFDWEAIRGHPIISHNAAFDRAVYRRLVEDGKAPPGFETNWNCTANMAAYLSGGAIRSLKDASHEWLGVEMSKDVRDDLAGKRLKDLIADGSYERTRQYAAADAVNCWRLWDKLSGQWPDVEKDASLMTIDHTVLGVNIDKIRLEAELADLKEAIWRTEKVIPWVESGRKPTSPLALAEQCRLAGIPAPPVKDENEEGFLIWEATYGPQFPWVNAVSRLRSLRKVLAGHEHIQSRLRPDGRFDFGLYYCGAHTRRWSGAGGFNMQNLRANPLVIDMSRGGAVIPSAEAKKLGYKKSEGPIRCINQRALFVPGEGYEMVTVDLAQIEPRLLHWTVGNADLLDKVAAGMSIYEAYARVTPKDKPLWTRDEELKVANPLLYKAVKIQVLQLGYGSGWRTFLTQALEAGLPMSGEQAEKVVEEFRAGNPGIVGLWNDLGQAFRDAHLSFGAEAGKRDFVLPFPNGETMVYKRVHRALQRVDIDPFDGKSKPRYGMAAWAGGRRSFFYGGKLAENYIQALARFAFGEKAVALWRRGYRVLWTVHDEVVLEIPTPSSPKHDEILSIMREPISWLPNCPLDAELSVVAHYTK